VVKIISIPKTPKSAYNPKRKVSQLLKAHISNLEAVTRKSPQPTPVKRPKTESQASAYIAAMTRQLHPSVVADVRGVAAADAPAVPLPAYAPKAETTKAKLRTKAKTKPKIRRRPKTAQRRGKQQR
jgi:hypothetical protein